MEYDFTTILTTAGKAIYVSLGLIALYGAFSVILLMRRIAEKRFSGPSAKTFFEEVSDHLKNQRFDSVAELCDSPLYWSKAVPQLMTVGLSNRDRGPSKLRRLLAEKFERDVLADLEYRISWVNTIVKSAPMLGLLGTVIGMIKAFAQINDMQRSGGESISSQLAGDISFALFTTALGLLVAIPLVMAGAMINVRIGKLQDSVQEQIGEFIEDLESADSASGGSTA